MLQSKEESTGSDSSLAARLGERIRREGPISFRDWMEAALYDRQEGYYRRAGLRRWGRSGDYRTAPERTPLFAATFADYVAGLYEEAGSPGGWTIFEAGAGAGHFAEILLETLQREHPRLFSLTRYVIDEASEDALERAKERLHAFAGRVEYARLDGAGSCEGVVFSNELLDAFPVHRVLMRGGRLRELYVGQDDAGGFVWTEGELSSPRLNAYFTSAGVELAEGQTAEVNLEAEEWIKTAAYALKRGHLITVDYGAEAQELYGPGRPAGTLRAFHQHRFADDVLARPGEQDLTATVDWTNVIRAGEELGLRTVAFERLDRFLIRAGLLGRLERMSAEAQGEADALVLRTGARELILPGGMGESFQVLVQSRGI